MNDPEPFPVSVDLVRAENRLLVEWEDGARSAWSGDQLRWACPCAECRGEMGSGGLLDRVRELPEAELQLQDARLIGQYALGLGFASGHSTGIYTFRYLRSLSSDPR
ncbi:MAG TPA: DUF971 domain-containing protein [Candidatus Dormibacteraeota bacterium]